MKKMLLLIILLAAIAVFVWPTRFKHYDAGEGPYAEWAGSMKTRTDRITGAVFVISATGEWTL